MLDHVHTLADPVVDVTTGGVLAEEGERCVIRQRLHARGRCVGLLCETPDGRRFVLDPGALVSGTSIRARFRDLPLDGHRIAGSQ